MCGIYGELCLAAGERPRDGAAATDLLAHRGPDDRGTYADDDVFLGVRRLAVMDPAHGRQPMRGRDVVLAYNGELYNFAALRRDLAARGHAFRTTGDTEVVLRAYEEWGIACVERFEGMFALAVWDVRRRTLVLARDPLGEKPLYHLADGRRLLFASEPKAILAHVAPPVDVQGLGDFLAFGHTVAPRTIHAGLLKLPPGHRLVADAGGVRIEPFWDLVPRAGDVRALLERSVRARAVADVPVGAFLSGGLDSTAVVTFMPRAAGPLHTFAAGFDGGPDELAAARDVARVLGTTHHELRVGPADVEPALHALAAAHDEPFADPASIPLMLLSRRAREHVKVVLTGDGADELFGGYRRYAAEQLARPYAALPEVARDRVRGAIEALPRTRRLKRAAAALAEADPARRYGAWLDLRRPDLLAGDVRAALADHDPLTPYSHHYAALDTDHLNRVMYSDLKTWLADGYLEKVDKATMACGLEARLPFLAPPLVAAAFAVPGGAKVRGASTKRGLKRALRGVVPPEVLRRRKRGFTVPVDAWLRGPLLPFARHVLLDPVTRDHLDHPAVERALREHAAGTRAHHEALWPLLTLGVWLGSRA